MHAGLASRTFLNGVALWIVLNGVAFLVIDWYEAAGRPAPRRPSNPALRAFRPHSADSLPYRLMPPSTIAAGQRYPLLVFLHGAGERGDDNQTQLLGLPEQLVEPDWRASYPCFVLAPQCPRESFWTRHDQELLTLIRGIEQEHPIDHERIYLTGLSMGGYGSWLLAARAPDLFAAVVPICGGGDPDNAARLTNLPIWAVHGDADTTVNVNQTRRMVGAIRSAGGSPRYTELKGVGHNSWTQTYRDPDGVLKWMFEQRNSRAARASTSN